MTTSVRKPDAIRTFGRGDLCIAKAHRSNCQNSESTSHKQLRLGATSAYPACNARFRPDKRA